MRSSESPTCTGTEDERRNRERTEPDWLQCGHGFVLDVTGDGIRILARKKLRGLLTLRLYNNQEGFEHPAEVMWTRRVAFRQHEVGLRFVDFGPEVAERITSLGRGFD